TGAEKADAGDDIGDDAHRAIGAGYAVGEIDKGRRANADQHVGAQTGAALAVLPFGADQRAQHEGDEQADERIEEIVELERMDELHGEASIESQEYCAQYRSRT